MARPEIRGGKESHPAQGADVHAEGSRGPGLVLRRRRQVPSAGRSSPGANVSTGGSQRLAPPCLPALTLCRVGAVAPACTPGSRALSSALGGMRGTCVLTATSPLSSTALILIWSLESLQDAPRAGSKDCRREPPSRRDHLASGGAKPGGFSKGTLCGRYLVMAWHCVLEDSRPTVNAVPVPCP